MNQNGQSATQSRAPRPANIARKRKALLICGSYNQTTQMHKVGKQLPYETYYTPYYASGLADQVLEAGLGEMTIGGKKMTKRCLDYLEANNLRIDHKGRQHDYDLVVTCQDQIVPANIRNKKVVLVQEGMVDPPTLLFHLSKFVPFIPRWMSGTAATGQSLVFEKFCVASPGFRDYFVKHGVPEDRIVVTGIPNFDNCAEYLDNDFPYKNYVLVCTSDMRETFKYDNRKKFIRHALDVAAGRQLIFKLHPNEKERSIREIEAYAPGSLVYTNGCAEHMVANADVVICQYSSLALVALGLGKEVHSYFDINNLRQIQPVQNGCAAEKIAEVCMNVLGDLATLEVPNESARRGSGQVGFEPTPRKDLVAARTEAVAHSHAGAGLGGIDAF